MNQTYAGFDFLCLTFLVLTLTIFLSSKLQATQALTVASPNRILEVQCWLDDDGQPFYSIQRLGSDVLKPSRMGFLLDGNLSLAEGFDIESHKGTTFDETWTQVWGEKKEIRNHYNELRINLKKSKSPKHKMSIVFRVYDDGIGFRYEIPNQSSLKSFKIIDEITEFAFSGDHQAWWIPAYQWNRYEYHYQESPLSKLDTVHTPLTMESEDGLFISIHEAALTDFASMTLAHSGDNTLIADLVPWSDGVKVKTGAPMVSPWRTLQIADNAGELITSYLILNLNEPNKLQDVSWIKPGKYVGIWWEMHLGTATWGSGEKHGATSANTRRYIDFAAEHGFDGVLVEGWNIGWDGDWIANGDKFSFTRPYPDFDLEGLAAYALEKGVRLIGHHETAGGIINYEKQLRDAYKLYNRLGIRAVKTGYVRHANEIERLDENGKRIAGEWHHGQYMVRHYRKSVEEAVKHQIMLNIYEPIKDTGERRTYPNLLSREGAWGQEFNAWGGDGGSPTEHTSILPFTRMLAGPMDYTPGIFDLLFEKSRPENRVKTTLTHQLALYVVLYSPLHMAADLPENYEARPEPFQFIKDVPVDWEDTRVLHAQIGDYITTVRKDRHSDDWFLGSICDENGRVLSAPLHFLESDKQYVAEIYRDGPGADWREKPYDYEITEQLVDQSTVLSIRLAPGGGQAIRFRPATDDDRSRLEGK